MTMDRAQAITRSTPYDCGHDRDEDHDEYCGVGACSLCLHLALIDGLAPHGNVMRAERTLTISLRVTPANRIALRPSDRVLFRARVCNDCGPSEAMRGATIDPALIEWSVSP